MRRPRKVDTHIHGMCVESPVSPVVSSRRKRVDYVNKQRYVLVDSK